MIEYDSNHRRRYYDQFGEMEWERVVSRDASIWGRT